MKHHNYFKQMKYRPEYRPEYKHDEPEHTMLENILISGSAVLLLWAGCNALWMIWCAI